MFFGDGQTILFIAGTGFLAAFVDSIAGGGGIISLPALILAGLPVNIALGTNKVASTMASVTSTFKFALSKKIDWKVIGWQIPLTAIGSFFGVFLVAFISSAVLQPLVIVMLVLLTVYTVLKKDWHNRKEGILPEINKWTRSSFFLFSAFALGAYDGFFGPGTGSFLIFIFLLKGYDFVFAAGNAKVLNCVSNIVALIAFASHGLVNYYYGLIMGIAMLFGAILGTHVAINNGAKCIRPIYIVMTLLVVCKQFWGWLINFK